MAVVRWGLISDIHGNLPALEAALAHFSATGVERIAVLGDNLGRGDSDGCVRLIRERADLSVVGNRDLDWQERVGAETQAYVQALPRVIATDGLLLAHGDARLTPDLSSSDIRRGFRRARKAMQAAGAWIWLFGHTHHARIWRLDDQVASTLLFDAAADRLPAQIELEPVRSLTGCRLVVNVGSAGLPFPGKGPASAAILHVEDDGRGRVEFVPLERTATRRRSRPA
jgi:predicted phosphodiesterase